VGNQPLRAVRGYKHRVKKQGGTLFCKKGKNRNLQRGGGYISRMNPSNKNRNEKLLSSDETGGQQWWKVHGGN